MSVQNITEIHPIVLKIFQSGPEWWAETNIVIPGGKNLRSSQDDVYGSVLVSEHTVI